MKLEDISFVVIALNEQFVIGKCLSSIMEMDLVNCEVICIDSGSTDSTLSIMRTYVDKIDNFSIFTICGQANAAIARNVGIVNAVKKYVFFIDGDVTIDSNFIVAAIEKMNKNLCVAVTGSLKEFQYDFDYSNLLLIVEDRFEIDEVKPTYFSGGIFIATLESIKNTGIFCEELSFFEDADFTLRLTVNHKLLAIPVNMGIHHTVPYCNYKRIISMLKQMHGLYLSILIRRNLLKNLKGVFCYFKYQKGLSVGLCIIIFTLIAIFYGGNLLILTPVFFLLDIFLGLFKGKKIIHRLTVHYVLPFQILIGFCLPSLPKKKYSIAKVDVRLEIK